MTSMDELKQLGPIALARYMHQQGQSQESNPYRPGTFDFDSFYEEMSKREHEDLNKLLRGDYA